MGALDRKLLRNLAEMKGQVLAICLVMACGVAIFVMTLSTLGSLQSSQTTYYDRYGFAHVFAHLKRAPNHLAERVAEIPGVARVQTRIVVDVSLDIPGMVEPAVGRLVSIPDREDAQLNRLHLVSGRRPEPGRSGEVVASQTFVEAHSLKPGARLWAVINGRRQQLRLVGVGLSPEYIYEVQGLGELIPDSRRFGTFWMGYEQLSAAYNMQGAFNDIAVSLMRGGSEPVVLQGLDALLNSYGGQVSYGRDHHMSHRRVSDELQQLMAMAVIPPAIFLSVAAFLFNVVISRLIGLEREQIAALKAFGYTRTEIGLHYGKMVALILVSGLILGTLVGGWFGRGLTRTYTQFFRFPLFQYWIDAEMVALAALISVAAASVGVVGALRRAIKLPPAEAMRPEPPAQFRATLLERVGLTHLFSQTTRMIVRQLERQPFRSLLTCLGIALSVAVLVLGSCMSDTMDFVLDFQFFDSQRYDLMVTFVEPAAHRALNEVRHLPGVLRAEPFRGVPVRLLHEHRSRRLAITGLEEGRQLFHVLDKDRNRVPLPPEGIAMSAKLADLLGLELGETVQVEILEGARPVRELEVTGLVLDFAGLAAYMNLDALNRLMREGDSLSGAFLLSDSDRLEELYQRVKETPGVAGVAVKRAGLDIFRELLDDLLLRMEGINTLFAVIIAFGMVYNSARITLSERSRELATLRVMGFTRKEISALLLGEVAVITLIALPIGLLFGYGFAFLQNQAIQTETQRFPLLVSRSTYGFAILVTLIAAFFSGLVVRRRLDYLDLIAVLKSRE